MIKLDENYTIDSDSYNWILKFEEVKEGKDKEGNPKEIHSIRETYHASFKQVVLNYFNETAKLDNNLVEILQKLEDLEVKLDELNLNKS